MFTYAEVFQTRLLSPRFITNVPKHRNLHQFDLNYDKKNNKNIVECTGV